MSSGRDARDWFSVSLAAVVGVLIEEPLDLVAGFKVGSAIRTRFVGRDLEGGMLEVSVTLCGGMDLTKM